MNKLIHKPSAIIMLIFICILYLVTATVIAAPVMKSLSDYVDTGYKFNEYVNVYRVPGGFYCAGGTLTGLTLVVPKLFYARQGDESLIETYNRISGDILTSPLTATQQTICDTIVKANSKVWIVDQYQTYPTRPVYKITTFFPSVKTKIGNIPHSTACGDLVAPYSTKVTAYEWRKVTLPDETVGTSVCRQE